MNVRNFLRGALAALVFLAAGGLVFGKGGQQAGSAPAPAAGGKPTLIIGHESNAFVSDYENNYLTQYLETYHGINIDFYMLPAAADEIRTKISLLVSSNDLPDILITGALSRETVFDYGTKGAFVALNRYLDDPSKTPNWSRILPEDKAVMLNAMIMADGNIYALPQYRPSTWDLTPYRLYFNRAWAEKLGIKVPATIGELRNALLAFRDGDPNGNGKKDEIGLYGYYNGTYGQNTIVAILNSFVFYNPGALALDDSGNTVTAPFTAPAFRKGIQYLNGLYRDGLLSAALFTDDLQQFRATLNSNPPVVGIASMGSTSNYPNTDTNANYQEMAPMIPPLTGPDGVCYTPYSEYVPPLTTFIASKSSNPDLAFKFIESFLEPDISLISRYGEEGVDWSRKPGDLAKTSNSYVELGLYPALTLVELKNIWGNPSNKHWHNVGAGYGNLALQNTVGILYSPFDPSLPSQVHNAVNYQYYTPRHPDHILPLLRYTLEDTERNSQIITDVNEYVRQSIAEFVIGARDINSDAAWGAYIRELENLGLSQWIQRAQATYNRQKGR